MSKEVTQSQLGKKSIYNATYDKTLLFPIPRKLKRDEIGVPDTLPFTGVDIWNAYELSWLNLKGKPVVASAVFVIPCASYNLIESKSLKLYLNSFNLTRFKSFDEVASIIENDLSEAANLKVKVKLITSDQYSQYPFGFFDGTLLDTIDVDIDTYTIDPKFLKISDSIVNETLVSHLLKSNCLVTGQPDWASIQIKYEGLKIDHEGLLKYLISFRQHNEFHEQCVERIFMDISTQCQPKKLSVYARYTRRGGLDINPFRSNFESTPVNTRLFRQ